MLGPFVAHSLFSRCWISGRTSISNRKKRWWRRRGGRRNRFHVPRANFMRIKAFNVTFVRYNDETPSCVLFERLQRWEFASKNTLHSFFLTIPSITYKCILAKDSVGMGRRSAGQCCHRNRLRSSSASRYMFANGIRSEENRSSKLGRKFPGVKNGGFRSGVGMFGMCIH